MLEQYERQVLVPLSQSFSRQADALLDLRDAAIKRHHPGRCVSCYFKLFSRADARGTIHLESLRSWLESNLIIEARDDRNEVLETLPVCLDDEQDLEAYCTRMSHEVLTNRVYCSDKIELRFTFKEDAVAA
ncbi:MAG: hypothetical protein AAGA45_03465 [Verrucomicrobiota bacterium]